ncbi:hypothetical protein [Phytobacter sp. AG2a]
MVKYKHKEIYAVRSNQLSQGRPWTPSEITKVKRLAGTIHTKLIARQINRSYESLRQMAKREGISLRRI